LACHSELWKQIPDRGVLDWYPRQRLRIKQQLAERAKHPRKIALWDELSLDISTKSKNH
jgi:hypothetical protein